MKSFTIFSTILLTVSLSICQVKQEPQQVAIHKDTIQKQLPAPDKGPQCDKPMDCHGAERPFNFGSGAVNNFPPPPQVAFNDGSRGRGSFGQWSADNKPDQNKGNGGADFLLPPPGHHPPFLFHYSFIVLGLVLLTINVLLTIIATLDMIKSKRFNGVWIPVVLIAGLPGAAIYALFRIGDIQQYKE
jgi:hypothetical protein